MKEIDFGKVELIALNGKGLADLNTEETKRGAIANILLGSKGEPIKMYSLAKAVYEGKIKVDDADWKLIRNAIEAFEGLNHLAKAQYLLAMDKVK